MPDPHGAALSLLALAGCAALLLQFGTGGRLGAVHDLGDRVHHRLLTVAIEQFEEAALAVPDVAEAMAFGREDERLGQVIILALHPNVSAGADLEQKVAAALKEALPTFMQPAEIRIMDHFPRNANGKLDRAAIIRETGETQP